MPLEEISRNWKMCSGAMMKDLQTWVKHENISRKPTKAARNIIDNMWVTKWKHEQAATIVEDMRAGKKATAERTARA